MNTLINNDPCILISANKTIVYDITFNKKNITTNFKKASAQPLTLQIPQSTIF